MAAYAVDEADRRCESQLSHEHPIYELFTRCGGETWR
jgi:hypothetical protein